MVSYGHTYGLKVIHISGHNRHAVNKGCGRDESVTIGARTGHVERGAPLGNSSSNRKDAIVARGQTWPSIQARRTEPCFRSRRSMRRIPISSSNIEIAHR